MNEESRWDPPPEGFTSIPEQGLMVDKNIRIHQTSASAAAEYEEEVEKEEEPAKPQMFLKKPSTFREKQEKILGKRARRESPEREEQPVEQGPSQRANPYGEWQTIAPP